MPFTAKSFASRHNYALAGVRAEKAARIANAMLARGLPEGESIATANKRVKATGFRGRKSRRYVGS
jgi:uncharacterized protein YdaT